MSGSGRSRPNLSPRARRVSPGTAREETKWAWDIHKFLLIRKQNDNFGFYIRGGKEFGFGIYVSGLDKGGYAEKQGLRIGDRIIRVNDTDFRDIIHQRAVDVISSTTRLIIYVTSHRQDAIKIPEPVLIDEVDKPVKTPEPKPRSPQKQRLLVIPEDDGYLGCSIRGGADYGMEVCVSEVDALSPAQRAGVRPGDFILKVNGMEVKGMTHLQVVSLATAFTELYLDIERKESRKMSLPMAAIFGQDKLLNVPPVNSRGRRYSGPNITLTLPTPTGYAPHQGFACMEIDTDEKFENLMDINVGTTLTVPESEPIRVTKLISRTIRLNLDVGTKDGKHCEFQESPKSIKRCQHTDIRNVFKEMASSPASSPTLSIRTDGWTSPSRSARVRTSSVNDLRRLRSPLKQNTSRGYASVMNIPPGQWKGKF